MITVNNNDMSNVQVRPSIDDDDNSDKKHHEGGATAVQASLVG